MSFHRTFKSLADPLLQRARLVLARARDNLIAELPENTTERALIENINDFGELTAEDVMVPRIDIVAIDVHASPDEFLNLIRSTPHSRIPVYQEHLDNIVGFIHIKDVLRRMAQKEPLVLRDLLRQVLIVSPALRAVDLLLQMQQSKKHLALVIDEYGGVDGLVTMGDLMEAIVGEISDEHNTATEARLFEKADGTILVDARFSIDAFEQKYGELFSENERNEADTLGGLAMFMAGRLPVRGELLVHASGVQFEITDADPRRVKRLRVRNMPQRNVTADGQPQSGPGSNSGSGSGQRAA